MLDRKIDVLVVLCRLCTGGAARLAFMNIFIEDPCEI